MLNEDNSIVIIILIVEMELNFDVPLLLQIPNQLFFSALKTSFSAPDFYVGVIQQGRQPTAAPSAALRGYLSEDV
jgi:hypothetical protein